jgi:hypothetical protein
MKGGVWVTTGRGEGPFIVAGGGHARVRKGETAGGGGGIKGAQLNAVIHDYGPGKGGNGRP